MSLKGMLALVLLVVLPNLVIRILQFIGVESEAIQSGILLGALTALLMHKPMRKAIAATALLVLVVASSVFTVQEWSRIKAGEVTLDEAATQIGRAVLGNPVTKELSANYVDHFTNIAEFPARLVATTNGSPGQNPRSDLVSGDFFRYLVSFNPRQYTEVRELAIAEIAPCESLDRACEIFHMLNYVAKEVKYVNDPNAGLVPMGDDVQSPDRTRQLMAGDCEDQTILLMTMLESVGIQTMIIFTEGHAYPMACTIEELPVRSRYMAREPLVYEFPDLEAPYCYPLEPTDDDNPRIGYKYDHFDDFIFAVEPSTYHQYEFRETP